MKHAIVSVSMQLEWIEVFQRLQNESLCMPRYWITYEENHQAVSEAYITVVLWTLPDEDGKQTEIIGRGRYLDHWLKRDGSWRIARREFVQDMNTLNELTRGDVSTVSARGTSDASFLFLAAHGDVVGQSFK